MINETNMKLGLVQKYNVSSIVLSKKTRLK